MYSDNFMGPTIALGYAAVNSSSLLVRKSRALCNVGMRTAEEIRRDNLAALAREFGGQHALADAVGVDPAQIHQWLKMSPNSKTGKPRVISPESARAIERKCSRERGWLDHDHAEVVAALPPDELTMLAQWRAWSDAERKAFQAANAAFKQSTDAKKRA